MRNNRTNIGASMLQPGRRASGSVESTPVVEMPMVLTIEQLAPNPDNPRTSRNPRYDEIKASIRACGLNASPKVTRDPDGDPNKYIFSDGGNTRHQILTELYQETGEERFFRLHVLVIPWPGRLKCLIGHLAENEVRGDLSFIEKAWGVHEARVIYEEQLGKTVSMRELSKLLTDEGLPIPAYQDDIEHLQNMAFIMAWELGEKLGCEDEILPDRASSLSPGYCAAGDNCSAPAAFLLSFAGCCPAQCPATGMDVVLIGGSAQQDVPVLDDENAIKLLRLMRVMRRLRELQRGVTIVEEDHDE